MIPNTRVAPVMPSANWAQKCVKGAQPWQLIDWRNIKEIVSLSGACQFKPLIPEEC